jgi:hypothetical protein
MQAGWTSSVKPFREQATCGEATVICEMPIPLVPTSTSTPGATTTLLSEDQEEDGLLRLLAMPVKDGREVLAAVVLKTPKRTKKPTPGDAMAATPTVTDPMVSENSIK